MPTTSFTYNDVHAQCLSIVRQMQLESWKPDYVVGLINGGMLPAVLISEWFGVPCYTLNVQMDTDSTESNLWMAEDAFGLDYNNNWTQCPQKNILVVNSVNNATVLNWIKKDWQNGCMPMSNEWSEIWHKTTKFAVLVDNVKSDFIVDYNATELNDVELEFPWNNWWDKTTS